MTGKPLFPAVCFVVILVTSGCLAPSSSDLEKAKAAAEVAKAEAAKTKAELELARLQIAKLEAELELTRLELAKAKGTAAPAPRTGSAAQTETSLDVEKRLNSLKELYNKGAINADEWSKAKLALIDKLPLVLPSTETRTLGQRFLDLKPLYNNSAVNADEYSKLKGKLLTQAPSEKAKPIDLEKELLDLHTAYNQSAIMADEWAKAKAEVTKRAK